MSKSVRSQVPVSLPSTLDLITTMLQAGDADQLGALLPHAQRQAPLMLETKEMEGPFNACLVEEAAAKVIGARGADTDWPSICARIEAHKLGAAEAILDGSDVSRYAYNIAEGSFALGLVFGMRLSGAR